MSDTERAGARERRSGAEHGAAVVGAADTDPAGEPRAAIRVTGARYRYAGARQDALDGIDLEVLAGTVVGVIGPNEAGKSTLCLVASGLAPVVIGGRLEGSVTIGGRATTSMRPHELAQACGVLFQNPRSQLSGTTVTVFEECGAGPRNLGLPLADVLQRVEQSLATLGIAALAERDPGRLSGGEAQLVALAAILALRPGFLVLDEPTSQLDPHGTRLVGDALARIARDQGTGILIVEHKTALLEHLADRVVLVDRGRVVAEGPAADMLADPALVEHGVEPPPRIRIRTALAAAGIALPAAAEALLSGPDP